jgi:hypothetical protein
VPELPPVRGIITNGVTVGGTGATERWCYNPAPPSPHGGVYDVTTGGVWTRASDLDFTTDNSDFSAMPWFQVREGSNMIAGSTWWYSGDPAPVENDTVITFVKRDNGQEWEPGTDLEAVNNTIRVIQRAEVAGDWASPKIRTTGGGLIANITSGAEEAAGSSQKEGLLVERVGGQVVRIKEGLAYAPGAGLLVLEADLSLSGLSLTANTWYYLYLFNNEGTVSVEASLQRPASPYLGNARVKGGGTGGVLDNTNPDTAPDDTRRYLRSFRTGTTGQVLRFVWEGDFCSWELGANTPVASNGSKVIDGARATVNTIQSLASRLPPTSRSPFLALRTLYNSTGGGTYVTNPDDALSPSAGEGQMYASSLAASTQGYAYGPVTTDSSQQVEWSSNAAAIDVYLAVMGYWEGS